jgi:cell division protein FtsL
MVLKKLLEKFGATIVVSLVSAIVSVTMLISAVQNNIIQLQTASAFQTREIDDIKKALNELPLVVQELKSANQNWKDVKDRLGNIEDHLIQKGLDEK